MSGSAVQTATRMCGRRRQATRGQHRPLPASDTPTFTATDVDDVATQLIALHAGR